MEPHEIEYFVRQVVEVRKIHARVIAIGQCFSQNKGMSRLSFFFLCLAIVGYRCLLTTAHEMCPLQLDPILTPASCIFRGVTLGRLIRSTPECDTLVTAAEYTESWRHEQSHPNQNLKIARWVLWQRLEKESRSLDHAQLHCRLTHGVHLVTHGWTLEHCDHARRYYELCVNHDFTPQRCLGNAVAQEPLEDRWIAEEAQEQKDKDAYHRSYTQLRVFTVGA